MRAINDNASALAQTDAQICADAMLALEGIQVLRANLATLVAVIAQLEQT